MRACRGDALPLPQRIAWEGAIAGAVTKAKNKVLPVSGTSERTNTRGRQTHGASSIAQPSSVGATWRLVELVCVPSADVGLDDKTQLLFSGPADFRRTVPRFTAGT